MTHGKVKRLLLIVSMQHWLYRVNTGGCNEKIKNSFAFVLAVTGCANQPAFCPEVRVNFCPAR